MMIESAAQLTSAPPKTLSLWEVWGSLACGGAVVMLVEITGTRIIGPVFGVSLFVWAALLSVTLCALALGYYAGGVLVDRSPEARLVGFVLSAGGVLLGIVPMVSPLVLMNTAALGPKLGPLIAALLLFVPSLAVLGMLGPIVIRLRSIDVQVAGQQVGSAYAVSTAGSLIGTLVTSFWLIPAFETPHLLLGGAALLLVVGAVILFRHGRAAAANLVVLPGLMYSLLWEPNLPQDIRIIAQEQSVYGRVQVIEDTARGVRFLRSDHSVLGAQWIADGNPAFAFLHALEVLPMLRPQAHDLLVLGLGAGAVPTALAKRGMAVDIVELDPSVVRFAQQYFGLATVRKIHIQDARAFINTSAEHYDLIVHDTFTGGSTPEHLLSLEVVQRLHQMLKPGGILALTLVGFTDGPDRGATLSVLSTLRAEFQSVRVFRDGPAEDGPNPLANLLFFASDTAMTFELPPLSQFADPSCATILPALQSWEVLAHAPGEELVTDARNGLARLQLPVAEAHYRAMGELLPLAVWMR